MSNLIRKILRVVFTRQTAIFLFFLLLSTFFWLMHSVGANRDLKLSYNLRYVNCPQSVQIVNDLPKKVEVHVANGKHSIFNYFWVKDIDTLLIDLSGINSLVRQGRKSFELDSLVVRTIREDFGENSYAKNISPHNIWVEYRTLKSKELKVVLQSQIPLKSNFMLSDSVQMMPRTVRVFGDSEVLDTMQFVAITDLKMDSLKETSDIEYKFDGQGRLSFEPKSVIVRIPVDKMVEKSVSVAIATVNQPNGLIMKAFPRMVDVVFIVPLSRFNEISAENFLVEIDYVQRISEGRCAVRVASKPEFVRILRLEPQEVEFSLERTN